MNKKLLVDLDFSSIIGESSAQTETGSRLLNKYKSYLMTNETTCALVNNFVSEAATCRYDNGVNTVLESIADYIQCNKIGWALSSVCERLNNDNTSHNYLNRTAVKQVEKLLENDEETISKYIKAGVLKNVMYVTEFRNIAKQVYHDMPMIESSAEFTRTVPISFIESCGDGYMFEIAGKVMKISDKNIIESSWNEVSNTFKTISSLLESNICSYDEVSEGLTIKYLNKEYFIKEAGVCKKDDKELTVESLREQNRLLVMAQQPRKANEVAGVLESIALTCEYFDKIVKMDNCAIYETKSDRFMVISEGTTMFATLLNSNHSSGWTYNCNVIEVLENIKKNTRATISEHYNDVVKEAIEKASISDREKIEDSIREAKKQSIKERIEALTEKFKNDPVRLAVISQVAKDLQDAEIDVD